MDPTLEKIYGITDVSDYEQYLMLGSGKAGICFHHGRGVRLFDLAGKSYLDCTSQGWALLLGHANEEIREVVHAQMGQLSHLNQNSSSLPRYALAKQLVELAPEGLNRVMFSLGGSAAIEAAMKLAVKNVPGANQFITLHDGYHGTSLTTGAGSWISTKAAGMFTGYQAFHAISNNIFQRIPNPSLYHFRADASEQDCIDHCLQAARETLQRGVSGQVAAIIVEPLQGSGGQIPLPSAYLQGLRSLCDEFGCLLIFDELQTFCRVGDHFAAAAHDVTPDILCLGKSLGAGFPLAAVLVHERLEGFSPLGDDVHTFANNSVAQVAALKQLDIIERDQLLPHTKQIGSYFAQQLAALQQKYPCLGDIRQGGLHIGIEFVSDPKTRQPALQLAQTVKQIALQMGLILGEAGYRLNVLKIKPPLIVQQSEADEILQIFAAAVEKALQMQASS